MVEAGLPAVAFEAVDIVFGDAPEKALPALEAGGTREAILEATGQVLGVAGCTLAVAPGEICVAGDHVLPGYLGGQGDAETKFRADLSCGR